ncbi:hypothetical protein L3Y34_006276 [Caenorhabditis briggsae]|uniref:C-type lectin domain-containing protein n=1 Tax=Caenorhabditis briggsae TaxID=6238 RepID=A0AAE8ZZA5_CAEBR|nr:hypothetical protein L3Y34_006276 [Caenorhabditis briggsae]
MIVIRANLSSFDNCTEYSSATELSFKECTIQCAKSVDCRVNQVQNNTCILCGDKGRWSLRDYISVSLTGIKVYNQVAGVKDFENTCLSVREDLQDNMTSDPLNMQTTTPRPKVCPDQWRMFQRGSIQWCLSVVIGQNYSFFNYTAAVDTCLKLNSTLSGPNGVEERDFVRDMSSQVIKNSKMARVWIDGTRKAECSGSNWKQIPECSGTNAFQFTDLTLQNFTGYTWNRGEPNGDPVPPGNYIQNCIHMLITPQVSHTAYGTLDDIELRQ